MLKAQQSQIMQSRTQSKAPVSIMRNRQSRFDRYSRHTCFNTKRDYVYRIRPSLLDLVEKELELRATTVFFQRVVLLAKNNLPDGLKQKSIPWKERVIPVTPIVIQETPTLIVEMDTDAQASVVPSGMAISDVTSFADSTMPLPPAIEPSIATSGTTVGATEATVTDAVVDTSALVTDRATDGITTADEQPSAPEPTATDAPTELGEPSATDAENAVLLDTVPTELTVTTIEPPAPPAPSADDRSVSSESIVGDYYGDFMVLMEKIVRLCDMEKLTNDVISGIFLYMGEYSMLMLEGSEDMIGDFCNELVKYSDDLFLENRVFMIEDNVNETYLEDFIARRIPAVNINEKFPAQTSVDEVLMRKQHCMIREKIKSICELAAQEHYMLPEDEDDYDVLPIEPFRKMLPEIQRIDLVLKSSRFYRTLKDFAVIYGSVPMMLDYDQLFWPIQNNYTPANIFRRSPYDVNTTFLDYNKKEETARKSKRESNRESTLEEVIEEGRRSRADRVSAQLN